MLKHYAIMSDIESMVSFYKSYLYLDPFCISWLRTITNLQDPFVATKVAHVTVCCAAATMLRVHLDEPTLHIQALSHELSRCFVKLNKKVMHVNGYAISLKIKTVENVF